MEDIYEQWDNEGGQAEHFETFAVRKLEQGGRFNESQAKVLVTILSSFVDDATKWQCACMDNADPLVHARSKLNELLEGNPPNAFSGFFRRLIFKDATSFVEKLQRFLPEVEAEEAAKVFPAIDGAGMGDVSSKSSVELAKAEHILDRGSWADELKKFVLSSEEATASESIPKCLTAGLVTDLLSNEEMLLKKLMALDCLLEATARDEDVETRQMAPIVAVGAARRAYKDVVAAKAKLRHLRLQALQTVLESEHKRGGV